jgi:hypothetical protein
VNEIVLQVEVGDGGALIACWDDPAGRGGITTQGKDLRELQEQVIDAVRCHFDAEEVPKKSGSTLSPTRFWPGGETPARRLRV